MATNNVCHGFYRMERTEMTIAAYRPTGGPLPEYRREQSFWWSYNWGRHEIACESLAYSLLRHHTQSRPVAEVWAESLARDIVSLVDVDHWGIHARWLARWVGPCAGLVQRAQVFWVPFGMTWMQTALLEATSDQRAAVAAMIQDRADAPLADYLADLSGLPAHVESAQVLMRGMHEGAVIV